jgi:SPP1 gp7 family putative phage head morphogenesis protein
MVPIEMAGFISPTGLGINAKVSKKNIDKKGAIARSGGGYKMALRRLELKNKSENTKKESEDKIDNAVNKLSGILSGMIKKIVVAKNKEAVKKEEIKRDEKITKHTENYLKKADKFELDFKKIIVDQFEREKNVVLDKFTEKAINVDDYLLDEDDETQILVSASTPALKEIIKEQGDLAMLLVGADGNFDEATKRVQKWLKERTYKFSFEMTEETNRLLGDSLAEGVKLGEGIPKLRKRIEELFDNMEKYRGERIARSEVIRASNFGAKEAYIQSDVVEKMEWLATNDDRTCEFCAPLDGKKIGLSDTFFDKGDTYRGSDGNEILLDYDDIEHPPLHANCRCTIIPVIK